MRKADTTVLTVEELHAKLIFKRDDATRERGLYHIGLLCGACDAARTSHDHKRPQCLDVHVCPFAIWQP